MLKFIFGEAIVILIVLTVATQIVIPLIFNWPLFWLFKKKKQEAKPENVSSLSKLEDEVDKSVHQYNKTKKKVDQVDQKVQSIKSKIK